MKTIILTILCFASFFTTVNSQNPVKPSNKINKNEFEVSSLTGHSKRGGVIGGQLTYRFAVSCRFKIGGGFHFSADEEKGGNHPGAFIELSKFIGNKEKWIMSTQFGKVVGYNNKSSYAGVNGAWYDSEQSRERFFQLHSSYRMNISKKTSLSIGGYYLSQSFRSYIKVTDGQGQQLNPYKGRFSQGGGGLRIGFIF